MTTARPLMSVSIAAALAAVTLSPLLPRAESGAVDAHPSALSSTAARDAAMSTRHREDLAALEAVRPGYAFWQHIFTIPDGAIAYGSALDGRLLAVFPVKGDWLANTVWRVPELEGALDGHTLPRELDARRDYVAEVMQSRVGEVLHNPTRGLFLLPNARRYGTFLREWSAIYERFGVPPEVGLAQAIVESGLNGTRRSEARAVGFCQWLAPNWRHLEKLDPAVLEIGNQTTQATYCGAYLSVLGAKYGSLIPALSEHHAGGTNIGRVLVNGARLGGTDTRQQYFLGAELARNLRSLAPNRYSDLYKTYGPRSYFYAEMVFGNTFNVANLLSTTSQTSIYGHRTRRAIPLAEIMRVTKMSADDVRRFNPALVRSVASNATLYLSRHYPAFGRDVSFWHRPASVAFSSILGEFMSLDASPEQWDEPAFRPVLDGFARRFAATNTEEGIAMATMIAYVGSEASTSERRKILNEYRTSVAVREAFDRAVAERDAARLAQQ